MGDEAKPVTGEDAGHPGDLGARPQKPTAKADQQGQGDPDPKADPGTSNRKANEEARRFREERNTARQELKALRDEVAAMATTVKAAEEARVAAEQRALKIAAGVKHGLPQKLVDRLLGSTADEIDADAAALAQDLPKAKPNNASSPSPANPASAEKLTLEAIRAMTPAQVAANWDEVKKVMAQK